MQKKELHISHHDRTTSYVFYEPENVEKYPLVIFSHGYNGHRYDFEKTCEYFVGEGIACASISFCGGSTRDDSGYPTTQMSLITEKEDLLALFESLVLEDKVLSDKVFLFGCSQGGLVSALSAAELKNKLAGLVLLFPALHIPYEWREKFPSLEGLVDEVEFWGLKLGKKFLIDMYDLYSFDVIGAYEGPVLILQGTEDRIVSLDTANKGRNAYKNCKLELFTGEGHGFSEDGNRRMEAMALYFIRDIM